MSEQQSKRAKPTTYVVAIVNVTLPNPITKGDVLQSFPDYESATFVDSASLKDEPLTPQPYNEPEKHDYKQIAASLQNLLKTTPDNAELIISGRLTLPAAWLLGRTLTRTSPVTLLQPARVGGSMYACPLTCGVNSDNGNFVLKHTIGLPENAVGLEGGVVAVAISSNKEKRSTADLQAMTQYIRDAMNHDVRAVVKIELPDMTAHNSGTITAGLFDVARRIHRAWPKRSGVALFIHGPQALCVAAGQAFDATSFPIVHVPRFGSDKQFVEAVIVDAAPVSAPPNYETNKAARETLARDIRDAIVDLKRKFDRPALPPFLSEQQKTALLQQIAEVQVSKAEGMSDEFEYDASAKTLTFSRGLLEALVLNVDDQTEKVRIGLLVFVHEAYHVIQGLRSDNYHGIGRAGFVLEEVDFWADVVAIGTLSALEIARGGADKAETVASVVQSWVHCALKGIEAFDRMSNPDGHIEPLYERRLRRYLIWYLQEQRAKACGAVAQRSTEDAIRILWQMLEKRVFVELAPLRSQLSGRFDKRVTGTMILDDTNAYVTIDRAVVCLPTHAGNFDLAQLLNGVRTFNHDAIHRNINYMHKEFTTRTNVK